MTRWSPTRWHDERGLTLIELVVAMALAIIVLAGLYALLELAETQSADATDRVDSGASGRTAMQILTTELHSSCVAPGVAPILAGSTATSLQFVSGFGSAVSVAPAEHVVTLSGSSLVDSSFPVASGSAPNWTFANSPTSSNVLADNVAETQVGGIQQPIFQYFAYVNGALSTNPLTTPLSSTDAQNAAEVTITFESVPLDGSSVADRTTPLTDSVVLRLTPPDGTTTNPEPPCQ